MSVLSVEVTCLSRFLVVLLLVLLSGCQQEPVTVPTEKQLTKSGKLLPSQPAVIAKSSVEVNSPIKSSLAQAEPVRVQLVDEPIHALPLWQKHLGNTLVLFADNPFLAPLPAVDQSSVRQVLQSGGEPLQLRSGRVANPVAQPEMAVRAALAGGYFRELVWVIPVRDPEGKVDLLAFRKLMSEGGLLDEPTLATFRSDGAGGLIGRIDDLPTRVVPSGRIPELQGSVTLHLDLGFFNALYLGEVKTPLFTQLQQVLKALRARQWAVSAATVSLGNHTGRMPLGTRFLGDILVKLLNDPALLDAPLPKIWDLRQRILYLENFFKLDEIARLFQEMIRLDPRDAAAAYGAYQVHLQSGQTEEAFRWLKRAVELDRGYALEYLTLADAERERQQSATVISWLKAAVDAVPADPFYRLSLCEEFSVQQRPEDARQCVAPLQRLTWSPVYYPDIPAILDRWRTVQKQ